MVIEEVDDDEDDSESDNDDGDGAEADEKEKTSDSTDAWHPPPALKRGVEIEEVFEEQVCLWQFYSMFSGFF